MRRRIKSISLTIPAVAGAHANVSARLELMDSYIEKLTGQGHVELEQQSLRTGISTSSAQDDSGLFQLDFRDERYLPFEGAGVISKWKLQLPRPEIAQFNYNTIADVIMHVRYTSHYDSGRRSVVEGELAVSLEAFGSIASQGDAAFRQLLSLRYDFPSEWARLAAGETGPVQLALRQEHFPYLLAKRGLKVTRVELFRKPMQGTNASDVAEFSADFARADIGDLHVGLPPNTNAIVDNTVADFNIVVTLEA